MPQLLLELLSEEIPARMQPGAQRDLERMAAERLGAAQLGYDRLRAFAGPRRLTLVVDGLPAAQGDRTEERKGPRVGAPEPAMAGFLRSAGVAQEDLTERDGVWFATISHVGRPTAEIIAEMVDEIVRGFPWPKAMTWGLGKLRWVRPLQRILCVFDGQIVPINIEGFEADDLTEGHRFMSDGRPFRARDFETYRNGLAERFVVLDADERQQRIQHNGSALCREHDLDLVEDDGLLIEVGGLAEWPIPVLGSMDPAFLKLPPEVIRTSMRTHQRYFAAQSRTSARLAPNFVVIANIEAADGGALVAAGNARVLSARLKDAQFFWDEDRRAGFDVWQEKLQGVTFHAKLGTMAERVARLESLAQALSSAVGADPKRAREAARLSKADLVSSMVGEFPELQGVMGAYYARDAGLPGPVADAIGEQYRPAGPSDEVPDAPLAMALAMADKLDTLVGFFAIGEKPTGSRDPYALRRAALGLIRIMLKSDVRLPIREAVRDWYRSLKTYAAPGRAVYASAARTTGWIGAGWNAPGGAMETYLDELEIALTTEAAYVIEVDEDRPVGFDRTAIVARAPSQPVIYRFRPAREVAEEVTDFLVERLKVLLRDQGARHDLVDAVFALRDDDLVRIMHRIEALGRFLETADGANLLAAYKRASNILASEARKSPTPTGAPSLLPGAPPEEAALVRALDAAAPKVESALEAENFAAAMTALAAMRGPVDAFFDKVLVNSDNAGERENRLKLLGEVRALMGQVADFSQVSG
ncbi:MAG TPA: glycine--tRNA ligase subunit beta [Caulobacteraceae bacterium]|jgi:glycyl-tRNA synthetase beta chain|nr:glycine--tRNA ligase subunit beta [Caulobacteraceae bacterium]